MDEQVVIALIGTIGIIISAVITSLLKEQKAKVRIHDSIERASQETAERIATINRLNYNELQEDLDGARKEINTLRRRVDNQNTIIDNLYSRVGKQRDQIDKQRDYMDTLRSQLVQSGIIPEPFSKDG